MTSAVQYKMDRRVLFFFHHKIIVESGMNMYEAYLPLTNLNSTNQVRLSCNSLEQVF